MSGTSHSRRSQKKTHTMYTYNKFGWDSRSSSSLLGKQNTSDDTAPKSAFDLLRPSTSIDWTDPKSCVCDRNPAHCHVVYTLGRKGCAKCANVAAIKKAEAQGRLPPSKSHKSHAAGCQFSINAPGGQTHKEVFERKEAAIEAKKRAGPRGFTAKEKEHARLDLPVQDQVARMFGLLPQSGMCLFLFLMR